MNQDTIRNLKRQYDQIPVPPEAKERILLGNPAGKRRERRRNTYPEAPERDTTQTDKAYDS